MDENQEFMELCKQLPKREWRVWDRRISQAFIDEPGKYADEHVETITPAYHTPYSDYMMSHSYIWLPTLEQLLELVEEKCPESMWSLNRYRETYNEDTKTWEDEGYFVNLGSWCSDYETEIEPTKKLAALKSYLHEMESD